MTLPRIRGGDTLSDEQKYFLMRRLSRLHGELEGLQKLIAECQVPADADLIMSKLRTARNGLEDVHLTFLANALTTHTADAKSLDEAILNVQHLVGMVNKLA